MSALHLLVLVFGLFSCPILGEDHGKGHPRPLAIPLPVSQRIEELIRRQDSGDFKVRDTAARELKELGRAALPQLRSSVASQPNLEAKRRVESIMRSIEPTFTWIEIAEMLAKAIGKHPHLDEMAKATGEIFFAMDDQQRKALKGKARELEENEARIEALRTEISEAEIENKDQEREFLLAEGARLKALVQKQGGIQQDVEKIFTAAMRKAGFQVVDRSEKLTIVTSRALPVEGVACRSGTWWSLAKQGRVFGFHFDSENTVFGISTPDESLTVAPHQVLPPHGRYPTGLRTSAGRPPFSARAALWGSLSQGTTPTSVFWWSAEGTASGAAADYLRRTFPEAFEGDD